jgi:hypothetical protein
MGFEMYPRTMDRAWAEPETAQPSVAVSEADTAEARVRLQQSLGALQDRVDELKDWRAWMRRHPLPFLVGAFGLGAVAGLVGSRGRFD